MQASGALDPPEPLLIVMIMDVSGYENCHFRDVKIKMSTSSAGFCSTFTHGYISRKHSCNESSYTEASEGYNKGSTTGGQ